MNNSQRHCIFSVDSGMYLPRVIPPIPGREECAHSAPMIHNEQLGRYKCQSCCAEYWDEATEITDAHMTQAWVDREFIKIVQYFQDLQRFSEGIESAYEGLTEDSGE